MNKEHDIFEIDEEESPRRRGGRKKPEIINLVSDASATPSPASHRSREGSTRNYMSPTISSSRRTSSTASSLRRNNIDPKKRPLTFLGNRSSSSGTRSTPFSNDRNKRLSSADDSDFLYTPYNGSTHRKAPSSSRSAMSVELSLSDSEDDVVVNKHASNRSSARRSNGSTRERKKVRVDQSAVQSTHERIGFKPHSTQTSSRSKSLFVVPDIFTEDDDNSDLEAIEVINVDTQLQARERRIQEQKDIELARKLQEEEALRGDMELAARLQREEQERLDAHTAARVAQSNLNNRQTLGEFRRQHMPMFDSDDEDEDSFMMPYEHDFRGQGRGRGSGARGRRRNGRRRAPAYRGARGRPGRAGFNYRIPNRAQLPSNLDPNLARLANSDRDFSTDDYEMLLRLDETIAKEKQGVNKCIKNSFPTRTISAGDKGEAKCNICLEMFAAKETVRTMPCMHMFHKNCIDQWLDVGTTCPVCKIDVRPK